MISHNGLPPGNCSLADNLHFCSGVLAESLSRSRSRWTSEGLFEKFWSKPHKRKGVLQEDPNNPPKDSMTKVGTVTITIEPHVVEATMFAVKTSKLLPHQQLKLNPQSAVQQQQGLQSPQAPVDCTPAQQPVLARPVIQYGPSNGSMPPPAGPPPPDSASTPTITSPSQAALPSNPASIVAAPVPPSVTAPPTAPSTQTVQTSDAIDVPSSGSVAPDQHPSSAGKMGTNATAAQPGVAHGLGLVVQGQPTPAASSQVLNALQRPVQQAEVPAKSAGKAAEKAPVTSDSTTKNSVVVSNSHADTGESQAPRVVAQPNSSSSSRQDAVPASVGSQPQNTAQPPATPSTQSQPASGPRPARPGAAAQRPAADDPVIGLLAGKASKDPVLRDLMKRVAAGDANTAELSKFQKIIDQLNEEVRLMKAQGPLAERLQVDGRTVKYFADEVRTILDIVLASNPSQKSSELRPPPRSDPLVVLLVKKALEDQRTKDMIRRIAEGKPALTDATDLKQILDGLQRDATIVPKAAAPVPPAPRQPTTAGPAGTSQAKAPSQQHKPAHNQQALRSKGPPPAHRPDISAVVFDFGSGDRYLFPRFSILEFLPTQSGQQVVASFLIVRKGSTSEYGGVPELDYYQPVTVRLQTASGRHLENLARVVAPQDEVRRYMDDVMDNMTRAEYVLLAMRLPRADFDPEEAAAATEDSKASSPTPKSEPETERHSTPRPGVMWTTGGSNKAANSLMTVKLRDPEQDAQSKYERLIRSVAEREVDEL